MIILVASQLYASKPEKLRYNIQKENKAIKLTWDSPKYVAMEKMNYSVQKLLRNGKAWCIVDFSANPYFYLNYKAENKIIRVCAETKDGYVKKPCTIGIKINLGKYKLQVHSLEVK